MKKRIIVLIVLCLCCFYATQAMAIPDPNSQKEKLFEKVNSESRILKNDAIKMAVIKKTTEIHIINHLTDWPLRPDYYLISDINPQPYIDKTLSEDRDIWFVFSKNNRWRIDWDAARRPLKYIGIHSSENLSPEEINEIYKGQYIWRYSVDNDPYVKGLEPHSGHIVNRKEVYYPFHWMIYPDGTVVKGLDSSLVQTKDGLCPYQVAWSLGNWEANCESFSMTFILDDPENDIPTEEQIKSANCIIDNVKKVVPDVKVAPHYQFNSQTNCPGWSFEEWGKKLH
jgi:hypothetical protein